MRQIIPHLLSISHLFKGTKSIYSRVRFSHSIIPLIWLFKRPKISIIIPVYNVEKYIKQCLDSITRQKLSNIEIICINDGSTDHSGEILHQYAQKDQRIKIITQPNRGIAAARNAGIKQASGEYILFVDSDDWIHPDALLKLYQQICAHNADICVYGFYVNNGQSNHANLPSNFYNLSPTDHFCCHQISDKLFDRVTVWCKLYRRELIIKNNIDFPEGYVFEDIIFHVKSFFYASKICLLDIPLYYYRTNNATSITHTSASDSTLLDIIKAIDMVYMFLKNQNKIAGNETQFGLFITSHINWHLQRATATIRRELAEHTRSWLDEHEDIHQIISTDSVLQNFYNGLQLKD